MRKFRLINEGVKRIMIQSLYDLPVSKSNPLIVTVKEEGRTLDQNAAMWPLLERFAQQKAWHVNGKLEYLTAEDWKDLLTAAFKNQANRIATGIDGGVVILGARTSKMTKPEFSDFLEFIHATAAEIGVELFAEAA